MFRRPISLNFSSTCAKTHSVPSIQEAPPRYHSNSMVNSDVESVNYHFLRTCNYKCKFCFHTAKTTHIAPIEDAKRAFALLADKGMQKINFSGGEPFLKKEMLGEMVQYCKETLKLPSVSIVSNGSKITRDWIDRYGKHVDILAISCDSFSEQTNVEIGRGKGDHLATLRSVSEWVKAAGIMLKINTTVCAANVEEDMVEEILELAPTRWKVFQMLLVAGENDGKRPAKRDARSLAITRAQFDAFLKRHEKCNPVAENNEDMRASYLILDEYLRFLDCSTGAKIPSPSLIDVGVEEALRAAGFDKLAYEKRGGRYKWTRDDR